MRNYNPWPDSKQGSLVRRIGKIYIFRMANKTCTNCGIEKPTSAFSKDKKRKDNLQPHCKDCYKVYRVANAERIRKRKHEEYLRNMHRYKNRARRWRSENVEHKKELDKAWRENNKERKAANDREWYEANKDHKKVYDQEYRVEYYPKNKYRWTHQRAKRRAAEIDATPPWVNIEEIEIIYKECKKLTRKTGVPHEVDHIVPLLGKNVCGLHVPWNLQIISADDNRSKGNKLVE
jgi:hypothetical protein